MQNSVGLGIVLWNIAVELDQVPQFGLDQCFGVGLGMAPRPGNPGGQIKTFTE